jgi:biopolymer transport protein ExbD
MAKPRKRRRKLQVTSLIDIIFLLLLFFMLTSTFSKFSEVELAGAASGTTPAPDVPPLFLQLGPEVLRLNGDDVPFDDLAKTALGMAKPGTPVLISLQDKVDAQRLTDLLVVLRHFPRLTVTVLGA